MGSPMKMKKEPRMGNSYFYNPKNQALAIHYSEYNEYCE
uniref:Uncharacterized protein n=1 Tax=Nelumbo nucifera TaxID=4432 RepID=A0A822YL17_NELNU|nr:TPA_asm: hypothetical protein HUJ06_012063 [Nelumbo nucifera]